MFDPRIARSRRKFATRRASSAWTRSIQSAACRASRSMTFRSRSPGRRGAVVRREHADEIAGPAEQGRGLGGPDAGGEQRVPARLAGEHGAGRHVLDHHPLAPLHRGAAGAFALVDDVERPQVARLEAAAGDQPEPPESASSSCTVPMSAAVIAMAASMISPSRRPSRRRVRAACSPPGAASCRPGRRPVPPRPASGRSCRGRRWPRPSAARSRARRRRRDAATWGSSPVRKCRNSRHSPHHPSRRVAGISSVRYRSRSPSAR